MATFKKGDEVVLVPRKEGWESQHPLYTNNMLKACNRGAVFVVTGSAFLSSFTVRSKEPPWREWNVCPEWVEPYALTMEND